MEYTLIVNPGSSSKKYSLVKEGLVISSARFERLADGYDLCIEQNGQQQKCEGVSVDQFETSLKRFLDHLINSKTVVNLDEITVAAIRIVAPGTFFQEHRLVDDIFIHRLRDREPAAPLHIPHSLQEIEMLRQYLPQVKLIAVSDSAFHKTMPAWARNYSIDKNDTDDFDIHRFGYHGISVASLIPQIKSIYKNIPEKMVVAHIGSGVSMTALKNGLSVDTSMGFSPDSGLIMGTRAGDLDAGALLELVRVKNMKPFETLSYIQTKGGLHGLGGEADFRVLLEKVACRDEQSQQTMAHFVYRFQKQLGAFIAALGGLDVLVLTATASERSAALRHHLLHNLSYMGIVLDTKKNDDLINTDGLITTNDSKVSVSVIRTRELQEMLSVANSF